MNEMYICPKCKATYSSNTNGEMKCMGCGTKLLPFDISVDEWRSLTVDEKEKKKDDYLSSSNKIEEVKEKTLPLVYHNFVRRFRAPATIIISILEGVINSRKTAIFIYDIVVIALETVFLVGAKKRTKSSWCARILFDVFTIIMSFIISKKGYHTVLLGFSVFDIFYYLIIRNQFWNKQIQNNNSNSSNESNVVENNSIQNITKEEQNINNDILIEEIKKELNVSEGEPPISNYETIESKINKSNNNNMDNVVKDSKCFCRYCGASLTPNAKYCYICGQKI